MKNTKWWTDFWSQPNAQQIAEETIKKNEEAVGIAVLSMQASWKYGDYVNAGKAYGDFWGLLMGRPILDDTNEPQMSGEQPKTEMKTGMDRPE